MFFVAKRERGKKFSSKYNLTGTKKQLKNACRTFQLPETINILIISVRN